MLFNSIHFLIFFTIVTPLYFFLPQKFRWMMLLIASCYFYMAFIPWYILILFFLIGLDFFLGIKIEKSPQKLKKKWLLISIIANIGTLFIFKYFNFFNTEFEKLFSSLGWDYTIKNLSIILPIGLSFHTFQSLTYIVNVYRGQWRAEKHLGIYALYVMFFPQLVAGPIENPQHMIPQFHDTHRFDFNRCLEGVQRMLWGFFKKIVIADRLAVFVDIVFKNPQDFTGPSFVIATFFFAFQIYCDFSGYCDIAIGAAKILGYDLSENFKMPYFSSSISEFWRRWHITLSSWFRDYVYIPLGGNRHGMMIMIRNLLITFALSGLWHGANWTYVIWGTLNGVYLIIGQFKKKMFPVESSSWMRKSIGILVTFALICFSWIFFRAKNVSEAWYVVKHLGDGWLNFTQAGFIEHFVFFDLINTEFFVACFGIFTLLLVEMKMEFLKHIKIPELFSRILKPAFYFTLTFLIFALWEGRGNEFIYFQF